VLLMCGCVVRPMSLDVKKVDMDVPDEDIEEPELELEGSLTQGGVGDRQGCVPETITRPLFWMLTQTKTIKMQTMQVECTESVCFSPKAITQIVCDSGPDVVMGLPPNIQTRSEEYPDYRGLIKPTKTKTRSKKITFYETAVVNRADDECADKNKNCDAWANKGECAKNPAWMNKNCLLACSVCTVDPSTSSSSSASSSSSGGSSMSSSSGGASMMDGGGCEPVIVNRPPLWFQTETTTTTMTITNVKCTTVAAKCQVTKRSVAMNCI